ncbi:hypothetical protein PROFUN_06646 [Planoprotostelium fungivorum]|uniref:Bulb-type lectin domain-containing protein n=1 Tax=Planoprotostelium fungivorum TaxID=1890364 RepID=A0A2P6MSV6_9EUKA|nr:hypothetical protein PROFUN_06646 [Planoprotostelium fungivorum]
MQRALLLLVAVASALSHCSMWHPSTFDCDRASINSAGNSQPLQDLPFSQWWWHNNLDCPPAAGQVFNLPANGQAVVELSTNKAFTSKANGGHKGMIQPNTPVPWTNDWTNIHAPARGDVAGCAFAISYKSDPRQVKPEDFVIFSVVHDCVARQNQTFNIPNLPACPNGKCMCSWFWIHKSIGGSDQMYMTPFVCNVTNVRSNAKAVDVAHAQAPRKCYDPTTCTMGPRNPMYWKNERREIHRETVTDERTANMPEDGHRAPTYSILYGWKEGAQKDIFVNTNPNNYTARAAPTEKKCTNSTVNPKAYGSRISSDKPATFLVDGGDAIISPNCRYVAYLQRDTGNLIVKNLTDQQVLWYGGVKQRGPRPLTLKLLADGQVNTYDSNGTVQWSTPMTQGLGKGPYHLDIINGGQLVLTDATQQHRWENFFFDDRENQFLSTSADPAVWRRRP